MGRRALVLWVDVARQKDFLPESEAECLAPPGAQAGPAGLPGGENSSQGYPAKNVPSGQLSVAGTPGVREGCTWPRRLLLAGPRHSTHLLCLRPPRSVFHPP